MNRLSTPATERLWKRMGELPHYDKCWPWPGCVAAGYGHIRAGRRSEGMLLAHRVAYESFYGSIADGMEIDHTCFNKLCVNPHHLEEVTPKENSQRAAARITHCPQGHPYDAENTVYNTYGRRVCLICKREQGRVNGQLWRARQREASHVR